MPKQMMSDGPLYVPNEMDSSNGADVGENLTAPDLAPSQLALCTPGGFHNPLSADSFGQ
jgi:hypothetical protein